MKPIKPAAHSLAHSSTENLNMPRATLSSPQSGVLGDTSSQSSEAESTSPILCLPVEMIIGILDFLDFYALLTCRQVGVRFFAMKEHPLDDRIAQVCRLLHSLVDGTARLQYTIELAATGMHDGPPSAVSAAVRWEKLKKHQVAWDTLTWAQDESIKMTRGHVWELYGGVLAQHRPDNTLMFLQLPSTHRGIERKQWTTDIKGGEFRVRDFGMDPSQDLLVIIETPSEQSFLAGDRACRVHLRTLSTGEAHPLAPQPAIISHVPDIWDAQKSFIIQVSSDYLGILFLYRGRGENEFLVWEWKTGFIQLRLVGDEMKSFAFLTEHHVLLATLTVDMGANLLVIDFKEESEAKTPMERYNCAFDFPAFHLWANPVHITIRSDPAPSWAPSPQLQVPFFHEKNNRLFVITLWVIAGQRMQDVVLFVPSFTLMSHLNNVNTRENYHNITWEVWGPKGTRMLPLLGQSDIWVCYVYGSKFVTSPRQNWFGMRTIEVYDFHQLGFRRSLQHGHESHEKTEFVTEDTRITCDDGFGVFEDDVCTSLPYRKRTISLANTEGEIDSVMCSEDNLIVVATNRQFRILTA